MPQHSSNMAICEICPQDCRHDYRATVLLLLLPLLSTCWNEIDETAHKYACRDNRKFVMNVRPSVHWWKYQTIGSNGCATLTVYCDELSI
jgi:hypothetical protein